MKDKKKILIIDNDPIVLDSMVELLKEELPHFELHSIVSSSNIVNDLRVYVANPDSIELILIDINMPEINGALLAQTIKDLVPQIRIMLMSGFVTLLDQIKLLQLGVEKILPKPFNSDDFINAIHSPTPSIIESSRDMIPIRIEELIKKEHYPFDLYIKIDDGKFLKIFNNKDQIEIEHLNQYRRKNFSNLFSKKSDSLNFSLKLYTPIHVGSIKANFEINFAVYYLMNEQYVPLISAKSFLGKDANDVIKQYNLKRLYIEEADKTNYQAYLDSYINELSNDPHTTFDDKIEIVAEFLINKMNRFLEFSTEEHLLTLKAAQQLLTRFLQHNGKTLYQLFKIYEDAKEAQIHSTIVASIAYSVLLEIQKMREDDELKIKICALDEYIIDSDEIKEITFFGALLHDSGKILMDIEAQKQVITKSHSLCDENHSNYAFEKFSLISGFHPKVLEIILQHEELCDGSGSPQKLTLHHIDFFSQVVIMANALDNLMRIDRLSFQAAISKMKIEENKYNKHLFVVFERLFLV